MNKYLQMPLPDLIKTSRIRLGDANGKRVQRDGKEMVWIPGKPSGDMVDAIKARLKEIVSELMRLDDQRKAEEAARRRERWMAEEAARKERSGSEGKPRPASDASLLAEMQQRLSELVSQIPADHVRVTVNKVGDADGDPILEYTVGKVKLSWQDVSLLGSACAIRSGAWGAFAEEWVASISRTKLAEIIADQQAKSKAAAEAKEAWERKVRETPIPAEALAAYRRYHGDAEKAWEAEDESAHFAIKRWTPYIEAQHGMDGRLAAKILREAAREDLNGVHEDEQ